jgi:hypothetical protein
MEELEGEDDLTEIHFQMKNTEDALIDVEKKL